MALRTAVFLIALGAWSPLASQNQTEQRLENVAGIKPTEMREFLKELQRAIREDDLTSFGKMIQYPLNVRTGQNRIRLSRAGDLSLNSKAVITDKVRQAVLEQQFDKLFVNSRGAMIGNGEVWVAGVCRDKSCQESRLRVIGINP